MTIESSKSNKTVIDLPALIDRIKKQARIVFMSVDSTKFMDSNRFVVDFLDEAYNKGLFENGEFVFLFLDKNSQLNIDSLERRVSVSSIGTKF